MFETLGMDVVVAGYEFAHRDDYEGRRVLSSILHTGQSKVLADIHYKRDPNVVSPYDDAAMQKKKETIPRLMDYEGLLPHMKEGQIMIDDYSHHECETPGKRSGNRSLLFRNQGQVRLPEDAHSLPADALLRL